MGLDLIPAPSPNHGVRAPGAPVDMIVLHYTAMRSATAAVAHLCAPRSRVSAHYLIDEGGGVYALVAEERRAWHAGESCWRGHRDINARSIGIELANPGHGAAYCDYPPAQIAALIALCHGILARHPIPARNVVGHADVAPGRKSDPGERFPWARLAAAGIGLWPRANQGCEGPEGMPKLLAAYGYAMDMAPLGEVVTAFQRHFRPARVNGRADYETRARLAALHSRIAEGAPTH